MNKIVLVLNTVFKINYIYFNSTKLYSFTIIYWINQEFFFLERTKLDLVKNRAEHQEQSLGVVALSTPILPYKNRSDIKIAAFCFLWGFSRVALEATCWMSLITTTMSSIPPTTLICSSTMSTWKKLNILELWMFLLKVWLCITNSNLK